MTHTRTSSRTVGGMGDGPYGEDYGVVPSEGVKEVQYQDSRRRVHPEETDEITSF